jgi:hypothetical protein
MFSSLAVPVDIEFKVTVCYAEERMRPRTRERSQQQDRCELSSLSLVREDIDIGNPVILDNFHEIVGLQQRLFRLRVIQAVLLRQRSLDELIQVSVSPSSKVPTEPYHPDLLQDVRRNPKIVPGDVELT